ncbi:MAG: hypothetical protein LUH15_01345 [Tannerellaceae bacterium]|nr:hypothetical protein [Tannerellaceae bacterium]
MKHLHYFNPGHETAVFWGKTNFTPSRNVRKMTEDLAFLPAWYAKEGDLIFIENPENGSPEYFLPGEIYPAVKILTTNGLKEYKKQPLLQATPWGLSPDSIHRLELLKRRSGVPLEIPVWKNNYYTLTGRQTAAECLQKITDHLPELVFPAIPVFYSNIEEIKNYLQKQNGNCLIKTPYSSSGRGLLWIENNKLTPKEEAWIKGAICKQGSVSIEPILCKVADYGWEFLTDGKGNISYEGISPFYTNQNGSFINNRVGSQQQFIREIYQMVPEATYQKIVETVTKVIRETYSYQYKGCIGVDIMIYKDTNRTFRLHPCVEINMRYTMGYLSLCLEKIIHPDSEGIFGITYQSNSTDCYKEHLEMQKTNPLQIKQGKIEKGYLSLCPVTSYTNYKATLLVK